MNKKKEIKRMENIAEKKLIMQVYRFYATKHSKIKIKDSKEWEYDAKDKISSYPSSKELEKYYKKQKAEINGEPNDILKMLKILVKSLEKYERYYKSYIDICKNIEKNKQGSDEDGEVNVKKIKQQLADTCWNDIKKLFGCKENDSSSRLEPGLYWSSVKNNLDKSHTFLWDVFPKEIIADLIESPDHPDTQMSKQPVPEQQVPEQQTPEPVS